MVNPQICNPVVTQTVSIEVDISGLAMNTILQASHIEDMEGLSTLLQADHTEQSKIDKFGSDDRPRADQSAHADGLEDTLACQGAFLLLSNLLNKWYLLIPTLPLILPGRLIYTQPHHWLQGLLTQSTSFGDRSIVGFHQVHRSSTIPHFIVWSTNWLPKYSINSLLKSGIWEGPSSSPPLIRFVNPGSS